MAVAPLPTCLQCGTIARRPGVAVCGRCGLPFGARPREDALLPTCPVCYREAEPDGLLASPLAAGRRVSLPQHLHDHERAPVGDDEWLESLREGDRIRIGRWTASFDVVRRYLVTGAVEAGRRRTFEHNMIVTAMTQLKRFGTDADIMGDQPEWQASREAVSLLMERYHRA